jgi:hypothetical protein
MDVKRVYFFEFRLYDIQGQFIESVQRNKPV